MAELESLTRYEEEESFIDADFSQDYSHLSLRYNESDNSYRFKWLTDDGFFEIAETINQEYPVVHRVQCDRHNPRWDIQPSYEERHLRDLRERDFREVESIENYSRLDLMFDDFLVSWDGEYSSEEVDNSNLVRLYSSGAGIWPFEHLYAETSDRDEAEVSQLIRDVETFLGFS